MKNSLAKDLAKIHSKYSIYSKAILKCKTYENNLIELLRKKDFKELRYLIKFYDEFFSVYEPNNPQQHFKNNPNAKNTDLFFIGDKVIKNNKAKYFFIFEGSLNKENRITISVLACLWLFSIAEKIDKNNTLFEFFYNSKNSKSWWKFNRYLNVVKSLRISSKITKNAYVVDALRCPGNYEDNKKELNEGNRKILLEEIQLLKPKIVICVGNTARDILGMHWNEYSKFHHVPFPTKFKSPEKKKSDEDKYREYDAVLEKIK